MSLRNHSLRKLFSLYTLQGSAPSKGKVPTAAKKPVAAKKPAGSSGESDSDDDEDKQDAKIADSSKTTVRNGAYQLNFVPLIKEIMTLRLRSGVVESSSGDG